MRGNALVEVTPAHLDQGEWDFIGDLEKFHQTKLEHRLKDENPGLILNSFIISPTSHRQIRWWDKLKTEADFAAARVPLQKGERETYIAKMFKLILAPSLRSHAMSSD